VKQKCSSISHIFQDNIFLFNKIENKTTMLQSR